MPLVDISRYQQTKGRLTAGDFYKFLHDDPNLEASIATFDQGGVQRALHFKYKNGSTHIVYPGVDSSEANDVALGGGKSLEDMLEYAQQLIQKNMCDQVIIPVAQNRYVLGILQTAHWTFLQIDQVSDGKIIATHKDPKSHNVLNWFYPLSHIEQTVGKVFAGAIFKTEYLGVQSVFDNANCGRYVLAIIQWILHNKYNAPEHQIALQDAQNDGESVYDIHAPMPQQYAIVASKTPVDPKPQAPEQSPGVKF